MALKEIDEAEYNQLVALRGAASKIVANPQARKLLEQAQKLTDPNAATPTLDEEAARLAPVTALKSELSEEIAALRKDREDEKRERTLASISDRQNKAFAQLRKDGYLDEGIEKIKKMMEDKGLLDVEDAVAIFERNNPPQVPVTPGGIGSWGFTDMSGEADKSIQDLISSKGQSEQVADRMARDALNDFRGQISHR